MNDNRASIINTFGNKDLENMIANNNIDELR